MTLNSLAVGIFSLVAISLASTSMHLTQRSARERLESRAAVVRTHRGAVGELKACARASGEWPLTLGDDEWDLVSQASAAGRIATLNRWRWPIGAARGHPSRTGRLAVEGPPVVRMRFTPIVVAVAALAACGAPSSTFSPVDADGGTETGTVVVRSSGGGAGGGTGGGVGGGSGGDAGSCTTDTWANYGQDFFNTWCVGCHGSGMGHQNVVQYNASSIRSSIASGFMPQNGGLSAADRTRIEAYLDCGAP